MDAADTFSSTLVLTRREIAALMTAAGERP
jgi:hypothetical protein